MFEYEVTTPRKDVIDFLGENIPGFNIREIGYDPEKWVRELDRLSTMMAGSSMEVEHEVKSLPGGDGLERIGNRTWVYSGAGEDKGLWIIQRPAYQGGESSNVQETWSHYQTSSPGKM